MDLYSIFFSCLTTFKPHRPTILKDKIMETEQNKENFSLSSDFNTDSYLGSDRVIDSDLQRYSSNIDELNSNNGASTSSGSINPRENQEICVNCSFWRVHP